MNVYDLWREKKATWQIECVAGETKRRWWERVIQNISTENECLPVRYLKQLDIDSKVNTSPVSPKYFLSILLHTSYLCF